MTTQPMVLLDITVNGRQVYKNVPQDLELIDFLHEELDLTGTKLGCGIGVCRACTVSYRLTENAPPIPILSCSTPVSALAAKSHISTIEGLASGPNLTALQQQFLEKFAFQCGYCTSGFLMAATVLVERLSHHGIPRGELDSAIAEACGAHICRCTGYQRYYEAIKQVIENTPGALT